MRAMDIATALKETRLEQARVVAGAARLGNEIAWVHMVDHPDIAQWVAPGQLLLSTGYNWPADPDAQRTLVSALHARGLAGVVLAVPGFLPEFPAPTVAHANAIGLPLLEIPWQTPFSDITAQIHARIIARQGALLERSEAIHRALTQAAVTATSLSDLAHVMRTLLQRDVTFVDPDGLVLGGGTLDPAQQAREHRYLRAREQRTVRQAISASTRPMIVDASPAAGLPRRLAAPVRLQAELVAIVWVDENAEPLSELDIRATEHAAVIAALHLAHRRALHTQEARLGYALVDALLEGRFTAVPAALERARLQGWDPHAAYRVCLILLDESLPLSREGFLRRERSMEQLRRALRDAGHPALLSASLNQITFLLPQPGDPTVFWKTLGHRDAAMAVSRAVIGADGIAQAGNDVNSLVPLLKPGRVHDVDEIMFPRALLGDPQARERLIEHRLGALRHHPKHQPLLDTLHALCTEGFQLAATARRLDLHISTLRYRIERIESLTGASLQDARTRFELQVALELHRLGDH